MRLLLDENLPRALKRHLTPHTAMSVQEMGWTGVKNGHLLRQAQAQFDALITINGSLAVLLPLANDILSALPNVKAGDGIHVGDWGR